MLAKYLLLVVLASVSPASASMCSGDQFEVEGECVTADKSRQPRTFTISVEDERVVRMYEDHERKDAKATVTPGDTGLFSIMDNNKPKLPFFTLEGKAGRFEVSPYSFSLDRSRLRTANTRPAG
jgi:hypothetical protein